MNISAIVPAIAIFIALAATAQPALAHYYRAYPPGYGYGWGYGAEMPIYRYGYSYGERHDPTDTNGF